MRLRKGLALACAALLTVAACDGGSPLRPRQEITDLSPRYSPDGSQIVFVSDRNGSSDLYAIAVDSGAIDQLTTSAEAEADPTYAPDGSIVYLGRADSDSPWSIYRLQGGTRTTILGAPASSAFPDVSTSNEVVYACVLPGRFGICVVGLDGSEPQVIHDDPQARDWQPVWSPDGQFVAFVSDRDGDDEIFILGRDGTLRQLTENDAKDSDPAWSPDGSQLAFTSDRDGTVAIWLMTVDGTDARRLADGSKPAWSPDGGAIAHHAVPLLPELGVAIAVTDVASGESVIVSRVGD